VNRSFLIISGLHQRIDIVEMCEAEAQATFMQKAMSIKKSRRARATRRNGAKQASIS